MNGKNVGIVDGENDVWHVYILGVVNSNTKSSKAKQHTKDPQFIIYHLSYLRSSL